MSMIDPRFSAQHEAYLKFLDSLGDGMNIKAALEEHQNRRWQLIHIDQWHEDYGDVLWVKVPTDEPPYVGSPLDTNWPGYHEWWAPLPKFRLSIDDARWLAAHKDQEQSDG